MKSPSLQRSLVKYLALTCLGFLVAASTRADTVVIQAYPASGSTPTACPAYCELAGNWAFSSLKSSATGMTGSRTGSRFYTTTTGSFSIQPTLGFSTGAYFVEMTHGSATSISANVVDSITVSGGSGLPATTTGFQQANGVNGWFRIGTLTLDGTTTQPTLTFTYSSGTASRTYADGFRFINTNDACLFGPGQLTTVNGPLANGQTFVNVPAVDGTVTNITIYSLTNGIYTRLGSKSSGIVAGVNSVTGLTPLTKGNAIVASQIKAGVESCLAVNGPVVGGGPNPQIRLSLSIRDNNPTNHTIGADAGVTGAHLVFIKATGTIGGAFGVAPSGGLALTPSPCWQHIEFNRATDPFFGWSGPYGDSTLPNDFASIDAIAFCVEDTADSGPFGIYIDNLMNGTNLVQNFESSTNGEATVLINQPSFSGSTSPYLLSQTPGTISPNDSVVVGTNVASGARCLYMGWQFKDDSQQDWLRATFQGTKTPNPIVDLRQPISFDVLLLPVGTSSGHFVSVSTLASETVYMTDNATFTITPTGPGTFTYQWNVNGSDVLNATNASFTVTNVQPGDAGVYLVKVNDGTCSTERSATLTVLPPTPIFTTLPAPVTVYLSQNATFTGSAISPVPSGNPIGYQWNFFGGPLTDATNTSLTISNAQHSDEGPYTLTASNTYGSTNSPDALLTVLDPIPTVTNQPVAKTIKHVGESATWTVGADGHVSLGYPLTYQWSFNGVDIPDATSATFTTNNLVVGSAGSYGVLVGNTYGSVTSSLAILDVVQPSVVIGTGTGLRGDYYTNASYATTFPPNPFSGVPVLTRTDPTIDFEWGLGSPNPLLTIDFFAVRWSGQIQALDADTYTFYTVTDDGVRLWVNGQLVIDHWLIQAPTEHSGTIALNASQKYDAMLEYFERQVGAVAHLSWSGASGGVVKEIIPMSQLYPATALIRPTVSYSVDSKTNLIFTWPEGTYTMTWATNVAGPYSNKIFGVSSPYTNTIGNDPAKFFRLQVQ